MACSLAAVKTPTSIPPTNPVELEMRTGGEFGTITDDVWYVPYQHYKLTKVRLWQNGANTSGFEVTFSPPASYIGWSEETHLFGFNTHPTLSEITFSDEITDVETCVDGIPNQGTNSDFEGFRFTEIG